MTDGIYHKICEYFRNLVKDTEWWGHLYAVGGCCRDEVMHLPIKDVDMAVDLPNGGIAFAQWLDSRGLVKGELVTFPRFGTARLTLKAFPEDEIELVQTRKEKYTDRNSRCPETAFGTIEEDCYRRDLTINSLYYDVCRDKFVDITGNGLDDIHNHVIRTPSPPDTTYDDDPVRIYRTIRFASRFGWDIDPQTLEGMMRNIDRLRIVTPTRCHTELERMLTGPNVTEALGMLMHTGAMRYLLPEVWAEKDLQQPYGETGTVWDRTLATLRNLPADAPFELRLAALFHETGKPATARKDADGVLRFASHDQSGAGISRRILRRLRFDRSVIDEVEFLVRHHLWTRRWGPAAEKMKDHQLRKLQYVCGTRERFDMLMALVDADNRAHATQNGWERQVPAILKRTRQMEADGTAMFGYRLPLSGVAIKRLKRVRDNRELKRCRDYLLKMACNDPRRTTDQFKKLLLAFR